MRRGGTGGTNTQTGINWEDNNCIAQVVGSSSEDLNYMPDIGAIFENGTLRYTCFTRASFWNYLKSQGFSYRRSPSPGIWFEGREIWSARIYPDEAILDHATNTVYFFEKKWQQSEGSVDEKLRTVAYRNEYYNAILPLIGINFGGESFVLSEWFRRPKYRSPLDFARRNGCCIFFPESEDDIGQRLLSLIR